MTPLVPYLLFLAGMVLLVLGGHWLVEGSVDIARRLRWSPLLIGLTLVAFGTSAPEFAFNVTAALSHNSGLSFGNVIGSNIANIGLVLGIGGLVSPLIVHRRVVTKELPRLLMVTVVVCGLVWLPLTQITEPDGTTQLGFGRADGILLLLIFAGFLYTWYHFGKNDDEELGDIPAGSWLKDAGLALLGLIALVGGGRLAQLGAVDIALNWGASEALVGLTIVAIATSLPELVTVIIACRKGHSDLAVGNIVGSNLFNLLLVLAGSASIAPIPLPAGGAIDLAMMTLLTLVLLPFAASNHRRVTRAESAALLVGYAAWMTLRVWQSGHGAAG